MALIVEDGSIVPGADSFISVADARDLAAKFGKHLPADDTACETALRQAVLYIQLSEPQMCGRRVSAEQSLCYPRTGVSINGFPVANNVIPETLKMAQVAAAQEFGSGVVARGNDDGRVTSHEEVVGAVVAEYFNNGNAGNTVKLTAADDALKPLICGGNNGWSFGVNRG